MRALRGLALLLHLNACATPEARDVAPPRAIASSEVSVAAVAPVSAMSTEEPVSDVPLAEPAAPAGVGQATLPKPAPCRLPKERPSSFGVKQLQHVMPRGGRDGWAGGELTTKSNVCPRDPRAEVVPACTMITDAQMDAVFKALVRGRFCALRHRSPPERSSPHYGSRSITVYIGEQAFEVSDSSADLLDEPSRKRFYEIANVITNAGLAATKPAP